MYEESVSFPGKDKSCVMYDREGASSLLGALANGPQQSKTDQDLHYTKFSCKIIALNIYIYMYTYIFVHTMFSCNVNEEFIAE